MKQTYTSGTVLAAMLMVVGCQAQQPPTQVIIVSMTTVIWS